MEGTEIDAGESVSWWSRLNNRPPLFWSFVSILILCVNTRAQLTFLPSDPKVPQARSAEELDAYGLVYESKDPEGTIALGERFLKDFPGSQFRPYVLVHEMFAYEALDNYDALIQTGKKAISIYPKSHDVLLMLANAIANRLPPNGAEREKLLVEAESYATQDREVLENLIRSPGVSRQEFRHYKQGAEAANAGVLGLIALQRGALDEAIGEYEKATLYDSRGVDYYRLGTAYQLNGQKSKAIERLKRAVELGPPLISSLARKRLRDLQASP